MKSKDAKKNLEDFNVNEIKGKQIDSIKGGQGAIIIEDAEGI